MQSRAPGEMEHEHSAESIRARLAAALALAALATAAPWALIEDPVVARAAAVGGLCLVLWLSEAVPPYVPTFVLWALTPLALGAFGEELGLRAVLGWSADPVLALFLGGFTLSAAASRYGIDSWIARLAVRLSRGRRLALLALAILATALLSMWMSNIAAAAMMIAALHPLFAGMPLDDRFRRALLVGVAVGANFGGIATPVGTGPNAIAIAAMAAMAPFHPITFLSWMVFALPLALGLSAAGFLLLALRFRVAGVARLPELAAPAGQAPAGRARWVVLIFACTVAAWLTEPLHGAPSALVALLATAVLFGSGLLERRDLARIDWSTLLLIAGGIGLGNLFEQSGLVGGAAGLIPWAEVPDFVRTLLLCLASALLSAVMSNTATATMLIPLVASFDPSPATAILIAIAASLGIPFAISTPPNAMVYGEGGIQSSDFLVPGLTLMVLGCLLLSATGPAVLRLVGIP
jgi:solute carrier family 13 (sodium-dependent dicarboxylate transporter), member 2/3/5